MRFIRQNTRTTVLTYGPNDMRSVKETKVRKFSVWNEQLVNKSFIVYSHLELVEKNFENLLENFRKNEPSFVRIKQGYITTKIRKIFCEFQI